MLRNRIFLKSFAIFFILEMVVSTVWPTVSYALTAGPTAPEATSFEPVDTTDMVNLATGDFNYNLPLIEVPGPAGGYPLSLSYHAGIQPNEDASWVGLGWSLNPGAINRGVNGYADDFRNIDQSSRTFWEGGTSKSYSIGVSVGEGQNGGIAAGLSYSEDTYMGVSQSAFIQIGNIGIQSTYANAGNGTASTTNTSISAQIGVGAAGSMRVSVGSTGFSSEFTSKYTNPETTLTGIKDGISSFVNQGISLATIGSYAVSRVSGFSFSSQNSKEGSVSTSGHDFTATIPLGKINLNIGSSHKRYWIDEKETTETNGSLYFPSTGMQPNLDSKAYDVYDLQPTDGVTSNVPPDERMLGSFVDYDSYNVLGQGISGSIKPYHYKTYLLRKNKKQSSSNDHYRVKSFPLGINFKPAKFRFVGDFSNRYEYEHTDASFNTSQDLSFTFHNGEVTGENGDDGYDSENNILPGSKHVDWFTNAEINETTQNSAFSKGFIDCNALGFTRESNDQIGGFKVTNSSGVTYHYALPVYSYEEGSYSGRTDEKGKHLFNQYKKPHKYAFTWLLTAVTGPDFVDVNLNGHADASDYGYWVSFEYGKWTDVYNWRNPSEGFGKDIDQSFNNFSKGKKEIYYLNSIKTKTHTAIFVKKIRLDGKGVVPEINDVIETGNGHQVTDLDEGGFDTKSKHMVIVGGIHLYPYTEYTVSSLKLTSILLFQNKDISNYSDITAQLATATNTYQHLDHARTSTPTLDILYHQGTNVIDSFDIAPIRAQLESKALKRIELNFDYSLSPNTANSFTSVIDVMNTSLQPSAVKRGKLSLKSIKFCGHGGASLLPDTKFIYDIDESFYGSMSSSGAGEHTVSISSFDNYSFIKGDIIRFDYLGETIYVYVKEVNNQLQNLKVKIFDSNLSFTSASNLVFHKTKNPPYNKDFYDMWGLFKVDYEDLGNENASRMTTSTSRNNTDVWSLRAITTSLGSKIKIEYEPDQYKSALKTLSNVPIKNIEKISGSSLRVYLYEDVEEYDLHLGNSVILSFVVRFKKIANPLFQNFQCNGSWPHVYNWEYKSTGGYLPIQAVSGNSFDVSFAYPDYGSSGNYYYVDQYSPFHNQDTPSPVRAITEPSVFVGGEVIYSNRFFSPYGGDIRVKRLIHETNNDKRVTKFNYFNGVTIYEPSGFAVPISRIDFENVSSCVRDLETEAINQYRDNTFRNYTYSRYLNLFHNSRELPGPGVLYGRVQVSEEIERDNIITQIDGYKEYKFEVFAAEDVNINGSPPPANSIPHKFINQVTPPSVYTNPTYNGPDISGLDVTKIEVLRKSYIDDFSALFGFLKSVALYDKNGNKINETVNNYLHDNVDYTTYKSKLSDEYSNQGILTETFADGRIIINGTGSASSTSEYTLYGMVSQKTLFPLIQTGQTIIDYKRGIKTETKNIGFDFYSGLTSKTLSVDGFGNTLLSETVPAYTVYSGMGLMSNGGKNMLTQQAASYTYKVDPLDIETKIGIVSGNAQTWTDGIPVLNMNGSGTFLQTGIWRKQANYSWNGEQDLSPDGTYPLADFGEFVHIVPPNVHIASQASWQKDSEINLYNVYSNALEASDVNSQYAATKMSSDQTQVLTTAANVRYDEFAFSGAEDPVLPNGSFGGGVSKGAGSITTTKFHTGESSLLLTPTQSGYTVALKTDSKRKYFNASVWVHETAAAGAQVYYAFQPDGQSIPANTTINIDLGTTKKAGQWYQFNVRVPVPVSPPTPVIKYTLHLGIKNNGAQPVYVDDFRVHPMDAAMTSYVYSQWGELSHILDNNNLFTEYRYDGMGRLKETYKETFIRPEGQTQYGNSGIVKVSEVNYNYGNNNPYTTTITASKTGSSGLISPSGPTVVQQGGQITFELRETCSYPKLQTVYVDSKVISLSQPITTLADGTEIHVVGKVLTFKNVQSAHSLTAAFYNYPAGSGMAGCYIDSQGCSDGSIEYYYYNSCGEPGTKYRVWNLNQVPVGLQGYIPEEGCPVGGGIDCPQ